MSLKEYTASVNLLCPLIVSGSFGPALGRWLHHYDAHKCELIERTISCFTIYQILSTNVRNLSSNRTDVSVHSQMQQSTFCCLSSALNASTPRNFFCVLAWYYTQVIKGNPVLLLIDLEFDGVAWSAQHDRTSPTTLRFYIASDAYRSRYRSHNILATDHRNFLLQFLWKSKTDHKDNAYAQQNGLHFL